MYIYNVYNYVIHNSVYNFDGSIHNKYNKQIIYKYITNEICFNPRASLSFNLTNLTLNLTKALEQPY